MNYSRRQLEAFGETLGECVTRKEGGRIVYGGGGSGGGGGSATQTQITDLPDWAKPYAEDSLKRADTLTKDRPYRSFGDFAREQGMDPSQVAGFTGMQNRAFEGASNLTSSAATGQGIGIAGQAAGQALGTSFDPYQTGQFGAQASQYMDPYMQNVVGIQQREAQRQADIQGTQRGAQAVQSGAFGGSRQAIMDAEAARNLATQQGDIQARGLQDAFGRGQQQFNTEQQLREQSRQFGGSLGLQGLQTALQGAGQLGALGGQQFGQQRDALNLQNQFGTQQQQLDQARINANMQDYAAEERFPYQNIEFMSNILRGTPMGTVQSMYQQQPGVGQQLLGAGTALYGASRLAKGGKVKSKAAGLSELALSKI